MKEIILGILAIATLAITLICWKTNSKITKDEGLKYPERIKLRGDK